MKIFNILKKKIQVFQKINNYCSKLLIFGPICNCIHWNFSFYYKMTVFDKLRYFSEKLMQKLKVSKVLFNLQGVNSKKLNNNHTKNDSRKVSIPIVRFLNYLSNNFHF